MEWDIVEKKQMRGRIQRKSTDPGIVWHPQPARSPEPCTRNHPPTIQIAGWHPGFPPTSHPTWPTHRISTLTKKKKSRIWFLYNNHWHFWPASCNAANMTFELVQLIGCWVWKNVGGRAKRSPVSKASRVDELESQSLAPEPCLQAQLRSNWRTRTDRPTHYNPMMLLCLFAFQIV